MNELKERGGCILKEANKADIIEYFTSKQVSKILEINPSTLRKYAGMIDEQNGTPFFERDHKNGRIYDEKAVDMLKRVQIIKRAPNIDLETAINMALSEYNQKEQAPITTSDIAPITTKDKEIELLHSKIDFIGSQLQSLIEQNAKLIKDNQELRLSLEPPEEENNEPEIEPNKKVSFFERLFKKK